MPFTISGRPRCIRMSVVALGRLTVMIATSVYSVVHATSIRIQLPVLYANDDGYCNRSKRMRDPRGHRPLHPPNSIHTADQQTGAGRFRYRYGPVPAPEPVSGFEALSALIGHVRRLCHWSIDAQSCRTSFEVVV